VPDATLPFPFSGNVSRAPSAADIFYTFTAGQALLHNGAMRKAMFVVFGLMVAAPASAEEAKAQATSITIYSSAPIDDFDATALLKGAPRQVPGMGIVQQRRTFELNEGETTVQLGGLASSGDFSTLSLRPAEADGFKVLSQSLVGPSADPDSMLRRAVGHEIIINRKAPPIADHARTPETITAKLLAFDQNQLVIETNNRQLPIQIIPRGGDIAEIKLMADSAPTHATVSARLDSKGGAREGILTYQANGMTWHADHELVLSEDQSKAHLISTITLINRSGAAFDDARVSLAVSRSGSKEYFLLPQAVSLAPDAAQRVALLDARQVAAQTLLAYTPKDSSRFAASYLAIDNSSKNNLGHALPAGRLRVIQQSANAAPLLLGDAVLPPVAIDDLILARVGEASSVSIKREIVERMETDKTATTQVVQITLRNQTQQPQKILLCEPKPSAASQIVQKSDEYQVQSQAILFRIELPASGEKTISYTMRRPAQ
jgi:hypothetical protein